MHNHVHFQIPTFRPHPHTKDTVSCCCFCLVLCGCPPSHWIMWAGIIGQTLKLVSMCDHVQQIHSSGGHFVHCAARAFIVYLKWVKVIMGISFTQFGFALKLNNHSLSPTQMPLKKKDKNPAFKKKKEMKWQHTCDSFHTLSMPVCHSLCDLFHVFKRTFLKVSKIESIHFLCKIMFFASHKPQGGRAPSRTVVFAPVLTHFMWTLGSLWVCDRHAGVASTKRLCFCRLITASFCVDTAYMSCV